MKLKHWKLGSILLGVLILLCWAWWPGQQALTPQEPDNPITTERAKDTPLFAATREARPVRPRVHYPECGTCPSRLATAEEWKRSALIAWNYSPVRGHAFRNGL